MSLSSLQRLDQEIARIATASQAKVGLYALHLDSGDAVGFNADVPFPMASVCKVPIAVHLLCQVEHGQVDLGGLVAVREQDISPGSSFIKEQLLEPGVLLSVRNLLALTLRVSDNTAG